MCLGVVGSDGQRMPLHWFVEKKGRRGVDQDHYMEVFLVSELLFPELFNRQIHITGT